MSPIADRSVTVRLDADIAPFVSSVAKAEAAARKLRDSLAGDIKIGADTAAATARIQALQRDVDRLSKTNARVRVDADTSAASSQLKRVDSDVSRMTGRSARVKVDADVAGALTAIALVGAALASLPAVTSVAVGVGALGGAFAAAGAGAAGFAAVAVPSLGRINEALQQQASAAGGAGGATKSAGQSAAEAASKALQLEQAERRVADAQKGVKQAQEDLTRARREAKRAIEDYALSVKDAALAEEDAALSVEEAAQRLAEVRADPESDELDIRRAELNHRQAMQRLDEQELRTKRLREDKAEADKKGVEGSDQVRAAQDRLLASQADLVEAQKQLLVTQLQQKAAMESAGGAAGGAASKFAELSKAEQALAKDIKKFQDSYVAWQRGLQPDVFPVIRSGMDLMSTGMKLSTPLIKSSAGAFNELVKELNSELKTQEWKSFFDDLAATAPGTIDRLGDAGINFANGVRGAIEAFLPHSDDMLDILVRLSEKAETWGTNLKGSPEFEEFIEYARENGPKVAEVFGNIATFAGKIVEVGADLGPGVLDFLVTLSDELAGMSPQQIEAIAKGVGLIIAAVKIGATLKIGALVLLAQVLGDMSPQQIQALAVAIGAVILAVKGYQAVTGVTGFFQGLSGSLDGAGKSADGAKGKLGSLAGVLGKGGLIAAAVAGTAIAVDALGDSLLGLNPDVDKLSKGLSDFGKGGQPAAELLDQLAPKMNHLSGRMETFADSAARLTDGNPFEAAGTAVAGFIDSFDLVTLDNGKQSIANIDQALAAMVSSGNTQGAADAFNRLASQAIAAGTPVDKLKDLFPAYASSLEGAIPRTGEMATAMGTLQVAVDPTAVAMERFNTGLDMFNAKTDTARLTLELKDAFKEAESAIAKAGGSLNVTAGMTDKQRDAVVRARDEFSGYIGKVLEAAKAAGEMAGKNGEAALKSDEARNAFIRQLPQLFELAGKSKEARDRVYDLAAGFGVNKKQADEASKGVDGVRKVIGDLKGKKVDVGVDTAQGMEELRRLRLAILQLAGENVKLTLNAVVNKAKREGGIERYATGGIRSTPPNVASAPTILYGEGAAAEAFIPYETKYRSRAVDLLAQVANDFGLSLNNQQAAQGLSDLNVTMDQSGLQIADGLTSVMESLESTMGQAGSLTGSIGQVGASADQLNAAWLAGSTVLGDSVSLLGTATSESAGAMSGSVDTLSEAIAAGQDLIKELVSGKGKSGGKSQGSAKGKKGGGGLIAGHDSVSSAQAVSTAQTIGEGSLAMVPQHYSKMSKPQQMTSSTGLQQMVTEAVSAAITTSGGGTTTTKNVNFYGGQTITKEADADVLFAKASLHVNNRG